MWAGSYVEPWLFRACVKRGGRPGDCSDDAEAASVTPKERFGRECSQSIVYYSEV
jgi:hypothetical protein